MASKYPKAALLLFAAGLCLALWALFHLGRRWAICGAVLGGLLWIAALLALWEPVNGQFHQIALVLTGGTDTAAASAAQSMFLLAAALTLILFCLEFLLGFHPLACVVVLLPVLLGPMAGIRPTLSSVICLALFLFSFWAVHTAGGRRRKAASSLSEQRALSVSVGKTISILIAAALLFALPLGTGAAETLWGAVYDAEGLLIRSAKRLSGTAAQPVTGGEISRGNNYPSGTEHLELSTALRPTETLYLRGFGGGEYLGGDWVRSSDEAVFAQMAELPGAERWLDTLSGVSEWQSLDSVISGTYYSMYYDLNQATPRDDPPVSRSLSVSHTSGIYETRYVPYYSTGFGGWGGTDGYGFLFYEQSDMASDWGTLPDEFDADWYRWVQDAYWEIIQTAYTQVPEERLPRLAALCEEHPLETLDEITAFILYTLQSRASYTLTPGWFPANEDIAEAFLFDVGRGYCQHFAVTGTLMYRLYGIPARYATGYAVSPEDFVQQEDGSWLASVTDESAHAWVEIFLEDYGWTPVEVTPAADGTIPVSYPGFDSALLAQLIESHGTEWSLPAPEEDSSRTEIQAAPEETQIIPFLSIDWGKHRDLLLILAACSVYTLFLSPLFLEFRRLHRLRKLERAGCRAVFGRLLALLRFAGLPDDLDGAEEDFPQKAAALLPGVGADRLQALQQIVTAAAFGPSEPSLEEEALVWRIYTVAAQEIHRSLNWRKKLLFHFWYAF